MAPTDAWLAAAQATANAPIVLLLFLDFLGTGEQHATRAITHGEQWKAGEGAIAGSGLKAGARHGGYLTDRILRLDEGGIGALSRGSDSQGIVSTSAAQVMFANTGAVPYTDFLIQLGVFLSRVQIRLGFVGLGFPDFLPLFTGVVRRAPSTQRAVTLTLTDLRVNRYPSLTVPLGSQIFPGTVPDHRGRAIPILLGNVVDAEALQVIGDATGTLAFDIGTGNTQVLLTEIGAPFPASGTIDIATETGVTYTSRRIISTGGTSYLALEGLTRGAPAGHSAGATVTLSTVTYTYLIGSEIGTLVTVREDGEVITSGWTLVTDRTTAPFPVSLLEFATQRGVITVDIGGTNLDLTTLLTNGGFETGDNTGWTASGATASITTTEPFADTYRLELTSTGAEGVYGENYQEVPTVEGALYTLEFAYQDEYPTANLLTNGGFDAGDLTGWTTGIPPGGDITVGEYSQAFNIALAKFAAFMEAPPVAGLTTELYQDVATTVGFDYALAFTWVGDRYADTVTSNSIDFFFVYHKIIRSTIGLIEVLSTDDPPELLASARSYATGLVPLFGKSAQVFGPGFYRTNTIIFTATTTTTRIRIPIFGRPLFVNRGGSSQKLSAGALRGKVLQAHLEQTSNVIHSRSGVQVGTPSAPEAAVNEDLSLAVAWTPMTRTFIAGGTTTRITLRSRFQESAAASRFDAVSLVRVFDGAVRSGSENPVAAIQWILATFLPRIRIHMESFLEAAERLTTLRFSAYLPDPGNAWDLLQRMAFEAMSWLYEDREGKLRLVVRTDSPDRRAIAALDATTILNETLDLTWTPVEELASEIYLWYARKTEANGKQPEDFQSVVFATPTESSNTFESFTSQMQSVEDQLHRSQRMDVFSEFIRDSTSAEIFLRWLIERWTQQRRILRCRTWVQVAHLDIGDVVQVKHRRIDREELPYHFEVIGSTFDAATMQTDLVLEEMRIAGFAEDWEYDKLPIILANFSEDWET